MGSPHTDPLAEVKSFYSSFNTRMAMLMLVLLGTAFYAHSSEAAQTDCVINDVREAQTTEIFAGRVDQKLFNFAVLHYVNEERCRRGLTQLQTDIKLLRATNQHSAHMAANGYTSHTSRQVGYRDLQDRLAKANVHYRVAGENVVKSYVFDFDRRSVSKGPSDCDFKFNSNGRAVERHSYDTLAKDLVDLWMESPTHKSNILYPQYRHAGATAAISVDQGLCGTIYAVQNFSS